MKWISPRLALGLGAFALVGAWVAHQMVPGAEAQNLGPTDIKVVPKFSIPPASQLCARGFKSTGGADQYMCFKPLNPYCHPRYDESGLKLAGDAVSYRCEIQNYAEPARDYDCAPGFSATDVESESYSCEMSIVRTCYRDYESVSALGLEEQRVFYTCET